MCCHQDGRLCCSYVIRCGDTERAVGFDGVVAGTAGLPELPALDSLIQPSPAAVAVTSSSAASSDLRPHSYSRSSTQSSPATVAVASSATSQVPPAYTRKYSKASRVDNSSEVSAKEIIFVSDSEKYDVDNKTETVGYGKEGSAASGESQGAG